MGLLGAGGALADRRAQDRALTDRETRTRIIDRSSRAQVEQSIRASNLKSATLAFQTLTTMGESIASLPEEQQQVALQRLEPIAKQLSGVFAKNIGGLDSDTQRFALKDFAKRIDKRTDFKKKVDEVRAELGKAGKTLPEESILKMAGGLIETEDSAGEKKIQDITDIADALVDAEDELKKDPGNRKKSLVVESLKREMQGSISSDILFPLFKKMLDGEKLNNNEQRVMDAVRKIGAVDQLMQQFLGPEATAATSTAAAPVELNLDENARADLERAFEAIKAGKKQDSVRKIFIDRGGKESDFDAFMEKRLSGGN